MSEPYTHTHLPDIENSAARFGLEGQIAQFAREAVGAEQTGFTLQTYEPGNHTGFGHRHQNAEEVYVVIGGSGRVKLDDEILDIKHLDAVRVAPEVWRAFAAGPDGLQVLAFGPHCPNDGEADREWWSA
jgi:mannose-6-phosphate isomerase-like protein (cupin superfamily)